MKNQYMIIKHKNEKILKYNKDFNIFSVKHGTIFTSKQKANDAMEYAKKYANIDNEVVIKIIKL